MFILGDIFFKVELPFKSASKFRGLVLIARSVHSFLMLFVDTRYNDDDHYDSNSNMCSK